MEILFILAIFLNFFEGRSLLHYLMLVKCLQFIIHLPLIYVLIPSNVSMIFSYIIEIVCFDMIDSKGADDKLLNFDYYN